jgi:hypothetical protein
MDMLTSLPSIEVVGTINLGPQTLALFIDETGVEQYGGPNFPIFGFEACGVLGRDCKEIIRRP